MQICHIYFKQFLFMQGNRIILIMQS